jgi:hypothetical protein
LVVDAADVAEKLEGCGEVVVTVRQHAQHHGVVDRSDRPQAGVSQRDDRGGTSIVWVGLVGPTRVEQSHPRRQRGRHIHDAFAGGDELLCEQCAKTTSSFNCPGAWLERGREPQQPVALPTIRVDAQLTDEFF